jgi:ArsR family transcriptional regulator, arsenate/arsenite/antimonite-responsive transcriptional repressor
VIEETREKKGGWAIGPSIATELDIALSTVNGYFSIGGLPEDVMALLDTLPDDWLSEAPHILGEDGHLLSILGSAADLLDMTSEGDYGRVTLAIRELTQENALARLAARTRRLGIEPDATLPLPEQLLALWLAHTVALYAEAGFELGPEDGVVLSARRDLARVTRILHGGDLHARFWHWLDRFYYGFYGPWREERVEAMQALEQRAMAALGAAAGEGVPPDTAWLPEISPLRQYPELALAVHQGRFRVLFWVEPFGLSDLWALLPGWVLVSFAEPGMLYQNFRAVADDVASRAKALADPTRLIILRMIRHFGMINTEMANALGLARPTVSVHAKILRDAGLIESHREGRETRHKIVRAEILRLLHDLTQFLDIEEGDN